MPTTVFLAIFCAIISFIAYLKHAFKYWERKNVASLGPSSPFRKEETLYDRLGRYYAKFKAKGNRYFGIYLLSRPVLIAIHPELIKDILCRDFEHFHDHGLYYNEKDDPLTAHLFTYSGKKWKRLRKKLTPTFTSGKMRTMFQTLVECSDQLVSLVDEFAKSKRPVDIKEVLACFTTDVIGSCAFGLEFNSFKDPEAEFRKFGRKIFINTRFRTLLRIFLLLFPKIGRLLRVKTVPGDVTRFFTKAVKDTVEFREKNGYKRKDFMQILLELKNNPAGDDEKPLTVQEIAAQCFVFFVAGFETSSTTMAFCLYELARNPHIQNKIRKEVDDVLREHQGVLTYDAVGDMKYLGQVVDETLRLYPPAATLIRRCTKEYMIPGTSTIIEKGTQVLIPAYALHRDEEYYPNSRAFLPERFSDVNRAKRHSFVYLPFGEGPRICIGMRFGLMQTKMGLMALLKKFKFSVSEKTQEPLVMDPNCIVTSSKSLIFLKVEEIL